MKEIFLLRHGDIGMQGRYLGMTDLSLTPKGIDQAQKAALLLQQKKIEKILCSPMLRCRQTLEKLSLTCPCEYVENLREVDFGRWEGLTFQEIIAEDEQLVTSWTANPAHFVFPEGEALASFAGRIMDIKRMLVAAKEEKILVVTHGGVIRHLLCFLLGFSADKYLLFSAELGNVSSLNVFSDGCILTGFNIIG